MKRFFFIFIIAAALPGFAAELKWNGETLYPMAMLPSPRVPFDEAAVSCGEFGAAGVRIFSNILWQHGRYGAWWIGENQYDFAVVDRMVEAALKARPDALFFPRIKLDPQPWWIKGNPSEMVLRRDGKSTEYVSMASPKWRASYEAMLRALIGHMERAPYASRILGYQLSAGHGGEWLYPGADGGGDISQPAVEGFRKHLRRRLKNDVAALRKMTGDKDAAFESVMPPMDYRYNIDVCRDASGPDAFVIEYHRFLIDCVNSNALHAAHLVKELSGGKKRVGMFFGYSLRASGVKGSTFLPILESPDIDFIASPAVYHLRNVGDAGSSQTPTLASIRLHGKLYFDETDLRTSLYTRDLKLPYRAKDLRDSVELMKRHFGYALTRDSGLWWFLLAGNDTFRDRQLMDTVGRMTELGRASLAAAPAAPGAEVAVFSSDEGNIYSGDFRFSGGALRRDMSDAVLPRIGAPFDHYVLEDIMHPQLPEYKVYLFLNAFRMSPAVRAAIAERVKRAGKTAIWFYAPDYAGVDGLRPLAVSKMAGMRLKRTVSASPRKFTPTGGGEELVCRTAFTVDDPGAEILGRSGGEAVWGRKTENGHTSVYSMLPLNADELRRLLRDAGVHLYLESGDVFSGDSRYLMLHASTAGEKRIALPGSFRFRELFRDAEFGAPAKEIVEPFEAGETRIYQLQRTNP